jgi:hypothetical protein
MVLFILINSITKNISIKNIYRVKLPSIDESPEYLSLTPFFNYLHGKDNKAKI